MREVLFLCTGNYYRSRYAEAAFNHEATRRQLPWRAFSRGLAIHLAPPGLSPHTARRIQERGVAREPAGRSPVQVNEPDFRRAARVVALKGSEHRPLVAQLHPEWAGRIEYWEIGDLDSATPDAALAAIEARVTDMLDGLEKSGPPPG